MVQLTDSYKWVIIFLIISFDRIDDYFLSLQVGKFAFSHFSVLLVCFVNDVITSSVIVESGSVVNYSI